MNPLFVSGRDFYISGKVTDLSGMPVADAKILMNTGSFNYAATSSSDGSYTLKLSGIYDNISGPLETGNPHPNPFSYSVNIPFIISRQGNINFSVYSMSGQKVADLYFTDVSAGSYRIIWDGTNGSGAPVKPGFYVYALTFNGTTRAGRVIKAEGFSSFSTGSSLQPVMMPLPEPTEPFPLKIPVITTVECEDYHTVRITDIVVRHDTIIDFVVVEKDALPFKTEGDYIAVNLEEGYRPLILKGINLGSSPPGTFPGEISYAISGEMYEKWITRIGEAGFNCIRIYTLHPPVFYETLSNYNNRHPDKPLLLFQGIWLGEVEDPSMPSEYDLFNRIPAFKTEIEEVIDCIHGRRNIAFRPGKASGNYLSDVSPWTAGYIIGREISSHEVENTNSFHPLLNSYNGSQFSISSASATEVFATRMLDETVQFENVNYNSRRPVSISSWPTLDPLTHPTEIAGEDEAAIDIYKITGKNSNAGLFATYHAYPYYPNFISQETSYQAYFDDEGQNSYLGYLNYLKNFYRDIPLVIGEFGVPSSWGSAHESFSKMDHGGYSEQQQGEKDLRLLNNIIDADCAGGFMFSWMDEWFKPTWIVAYLEAFGFESESDIIPTRQLWHNLVSPEQNFGLTGFDQKEILPFVSYVTDNPAGPVSKVEATNDNGCFYINLELDQPLAAGDTIMVAFDTHSSDIGESTLPDGKTLSNRSEFLFSMVIGEDTALYYVTEAYDMNGLTPRFNHSDPAIQKYKSTKTDGAPWKVMQWINDSYEFTRHELGKLPVENSAEFTPGQRTAAAWSGNKIRLRIPWTMLYFYDPTQMQVIDGAISYDGGNSFEIIKKQSDGIALSVCFKGEVTSTGNRYNWNKWLVVPSYTTREKRSLQVVGAGLFLIPDFAD